MRAQWQDRVNVILPDVKPTAAVRIVFLDDVGDEMWVGTGGIAV